jgi:uncharacterized protein (TIGR03118 family)
MTRQFASLLLIGAGACAGTAGTDENLGVQKSTPSMPAPQEMDGQVRVLPTNLTSDLPGVAANTDPNLVNAWGIAFNPNATKPVFWISANGSDAAVLESPAGVPQPLVVNVPGGPSGQIFSPVPDFDNDVFILVTEGGQFFGWQPSAGTNAVMRVDDSDEHSVYKGLALIVNAGCEILLSTDFHNGKISAYIAGYTEEDNPGFVDPTIPAGFAPFNVAELNGKVYVTYAKQDDVGHDDVKGPGNGFVNVFNTDGTFVKRLVSNGALNSPWGLAIAPKSFGAAAGMLLVGNFGDGAINIYDPETGESHGQLRNPDASPLMIDGLWGITVGPKAAGLDDRVFFTAGPNGENDGLFGVLTISGN